ncbi:MAG TPA: cation transporter, partial [Bacteroidaceae bacterium]|nr:cation transporter [Bacteroidaceae bacterium]
LTIGIYSVFSQDTLSAKLQSTVLQVVSKYKEILQTHGFYYNDRDRSISIDIVPDLTVTDEKALVGKLQEELKTLLPDYTINIVLDHNYSE